MEILIRPGQPPTPVESYEDAAKGIVFYTDNLAATTIELEGRGLRFKGTVDTEKCLSFTDLDGNWVQLVNPNDHESFCGKLGT